MIIAIDFDGTITTGVRERPMTLRRFGVCIINKWGHEAEDEIFNQYNELINAACVAKQSKNLVAARS